MAARISEVCAGVLDYLAGLINPVAPDVVEGAYAAADQLETLDGKRVRVYPAKYGDAERLARYRVMKEYAVAVVAEVPYLAAASPDPAGAVPPAWVDDQVGWVEANIFDPLNTAFVHAEDGLLLGALTCWTCAVTVVYDPVRLAEEKLFVSIVEVAYRESTEG
jgi:hypothetical protein